MGASQRQITVNMSLLQNEDWSINANFSELLYLTGGWNLILSVWQGSCHKKIELSSMFFCTLIHQSHRKKSRLKRSQPSKWFIIQTMGWLLQTRPCHSGCHRGILGSHTPNEGKEKNDKKNDSFDTFYRKRLAKVYRSSLSISCRSEGSDTRFLTSVSSQGSRPVTGGRSWIKTLLGFIFSLNGSHFKNT